MSHRSDKLAEDLKSIKFDLNYEQKTILNHYIRTPVAIINGILENISSGINLISYEEIKKELAEIVKTIELVNGKTYE